MPSAHLGPLEELAQRSAAPGVVSLVLHRLVDSRADAAGLLVESGEPTTLAHRVIAVAAASNSLGRLIVADSEALAVLTDLDGPAAVDSATEEALSRAKHLGLLRIAAHDLVDGASHEETTASLSDLASDVLEGSLALGRGRAESELAVIGMGKLGGRELNYASDIDVLFVSEHPRQEGVARRVLHAAAACYRVDTALRPDGRAGELSRTVAGYGAYWERWARAWELQALVKARPVAGPSGLGESFAKTAAAHLWSHLFDADELSEIRAMKGRTEQLVESRGLGGRELKLGPGGIRDVEFSVQLLQLVHGRLDPAIRSPSTLEAIRELSEAGYVDNGDAVLLARGYRFLRTVEHRLQLVEEEQIHAVPPPGAARRRLALVMGYEDSASHSAEARFEDDLRVAMTAVREVHDRLFFRPLLEAFSTVPTSMPEEVISLRLAAFGFADAVRTRQAVEELASGFRRSSRLMAQMLPLVFDWLSLSPDPDLGLLGLRDLAMAPHRRSLLVSSFRESPETARRLCFVLGTSRLLGEVLRRNPDLLSRLGDDETLRAAPGPELDNEARERGAGRPQGRAGRDQLVRLRHDQLFRIATSDILGLCDVASVGRSLSTLAEALLRAALSTCGPHQPFCVIGLGRLGAGELSYASDLDVVFVTDGDTSTSGDAYRVAEGLLRILQGPAPSERILTVDLALRPEGVHGALVRDLEGYRTYFDRWGQTWERQAMLRARVVAGDADLGARFLEITGDFCFGEPFGDVETATIRRMKARIERERIPPDEDPQFHLKLGPGTLSDVEWTVQLLQLRHRVPTPSTLDALDLLGSRGFVRPEDAEALSSAYRFCERTRNRWYLVGALPGGASPGDSLPANTTSLSHLARSLGTTPAELRQDYRKMTRRARRVTEQLFYGLLP